MTSQPRHRDLYEFPKPIDIPHILNLELESNYSYMPNFREEGILQILLPTSENFSRYKVRMNILL